MSAARGSSNGRTTQESVRNRLRIYNQLTKPLLGYYQHTGLLMTVDGALPTVTVFDEIVAKLGGMHRGND